MKNEEPYEPATSVADDEIKPYRLRQYLGAIVVSLGGFALGVSLGWNSSASEAMKNTLDATATEIGLIGGVLNLGACISVILVPMILKCITRTGLMSLTVPVSLLGWAFIIFANQSVALYTVGRFLCGFCGGICCVLTPIFVAEIAQKEIRGRLLAFFQLLINFGVMFAYTMAHLMNDDKTNWRYSLVCAISTAVIALVNVLPESPVYHLTRKQESRALKSVKWYRGDGFSMDELQDFRRLAETEQKRMPLKTLKNWKILRSFLLAFGVMVVQQMCGMNPMIFYTLAIFNAGGDDMVASEQCLIVGAVQIVSCALVAIFVDIVGRKILLMVSSFSMGVFLILLGWYFNVQETDPEYADSVSWMPLAWITLFFAAFNIGVGPVSWMLLGETFPVRVKTGAAAGAAFVSWLFSLIITMLFGEMLDALGTPMCMWLFAGFCWAGVIFFAVFVKEPKGKSLLEIEEIFQGLDFPESEEDVNSPPQRLEK